MSTPSVLPPPPQRSPAISQTDGQGSGFSWPWTVWFQQLQTSLNGAISLASSIKLSIPGPYANDAAAAAAGVVIGNPYYQPSGAVVVRLT